METISNALPLEALIAEFMLNSTVVMWFAQSEPLRLMWSLREGSDQMNTSIKRIISNRSERPNRSNKWNRLDVEVEHVGRV